MGLALPEHLYYYMRIETKVLVKGEIIVPAFSDIKFLAVLVGAIISMAVGFVWYSKPVFGTIWMRLSGISQDQVEGGAGIGYLWTFIGSLVATLVLSLLILTMGSTTFVEGLMAGVLVGVGFAATATLANSVFEGKNLGAWLINAGYQVMSLAIIGGVLAIWPLAF